jgi:nitroreductase
MKPANAVPSSRSAHEVEAPREGRTATHAELDPALRTILHAATLAPSSHNTQPWRFVARESELELHADRTRALAVNDPHDRELTVSCGCALFNLRVAAAHCGLVARVELLPEGDASELLARVGLRAAHADETPEDSQLAHLYGAIEVRRTYRKRFADEGVSERARHALAEAVAREGAQLHELASERQRREAAALVAAGDAQQWADAHWRRELAAWMHPRRAGDGLSVPGLAAPLTHAVVRTFDMGRGAGAKDSELAEASPLLVLLATTGDGALDWLAAGQALQRMLLTACGLGLQASYLNQPCQVDRLRPKLRELAAAAGWPQLLVRLGFPHAPAPATVRRALDQVVE